MMLIRGPAGEACLGTECRQSRWQRPPMTTRSPEGTVSDTLLPPSAGLIRNRSPVVEHLLESVIRPAAGDHGTVQERRS